MTLVNEKRMRVFSCAALVVAFTSAPVLAEQIYVGKAVFLEGAILHSDQTPVFDSGNEREREPTVVGSEYINITNDPNYVISGSYENNGLNVISESSLDSNGIHSYAGVNYSNQEQGYTGAVAVDSSMIYLLDIHATNSGEMNIVLGLDGIFGSSGLNVGDTMETGYEVGLVLSGSADGTPYLYDMPAWGAEDFDERVQVHREENKSVNTLIEYDVNNPLSFSLTLGLEEGWNYVGIGLSTFALFQTSGNNKFEVFSDFSNTLTINQVTSTNIDELAVTPESFMLSQVETSFTTMEMPNAAVPEPTTMLLFGTGIAGLAAVGRRRKR